MIVTRSTFRRFADRARFASAATMLLLGGAARVPDERAMDEKPVVDGRSTPVRLVVVTPYDDEPRPEIWLASSLDGWKPKGRRLERVAPGLYFGEWALAVGKRVEFKFCRAGTWDSVEKGPAGEEIPNRGLEVRGDVGVQVLVQHVASWADRPAPAAMSVAFAPTAAAAARRAATLTGDIRHHHRVASREFHNERSVLVYLPPGYDDEPTARYPVLYMNDGNNVFDAATSFAGVEWGVDETAERLILAGRLRKLIVVAIYNTAGRLNEYSPVADARLGGGRADDYLAFVTETVKPLIDRTYRTRTGPDDTAIAGSSLGGLVSLYALIRRPDVFGGGGVMSPSLWWADRAVIRMSEQLAANGARPRLWIDMGDAEGGEPAGGKAGVSPVDDCRELVRVLKKRGLRDGADFRFFVAEGGMHNEAAWARRVDRMLTFLFGAPPEGATEESGE